MIAFAMFAGHDVHPDHSYGQLVKQVLPTMYAGFFAAVMMGAILSSFNSALNSTCTLFSLGLYKSVFKPGASNTDVVRASKVFGWIIAGVAMVIAPMLAGQLNIFSYLQKMNGIYAIPIFAVVLTGMLTRDVPAFAAKLALVIGSVVIACGYFIPPLALVVDSLHEFHFQGIVFAYLVIMMLVMGEIWPHSGSADQEGPAPIDMTPWRYARPAGLMLLASVLTIYVVFADLRVLAE
jgi:SSS family solute:Na+ symporter